MRPDPTFFEQLLGRSDWGRCRVAGAADLLADLWGVEFGSRNPIPPDWDVGRNVLTLPHVREVIPPTTGEAALQFAARRAAAADANGNIYRIGDDRQQLYIHGSGSRKPARFWPDPRAFPQRDGLFSASRPADPKPRRYSGLAVTETAWLVASFAEDGGRTGLELFDLIGGGAPTEYLWPEAGPVRALDLAPSPCGGLWLLDDRGRLFAFDRCLAVAATNATSQLLEFFQPPEGEPRTHAVAPEPRAWILGAADPIAIEPISCDVLAVLSREGTSGRIDLLACDNHALLASASVDFAVHDMVVGRAILRDRSEAMRLLVTGGSGNQAIAFSVLGDGRNLRLESTTEIYPLRRYGGRALVAVQGAAHYDSGDTPIWVPLAERPVASFAASNAITTPIFDATVPGTVWDRLRIDGCIPPGTRVDIAGRSGDQLSADGELLGEWFTQPAPILSSTGAEFAGYDPAAVPATDAAHGKGTWELLLQRMEGRYLQLRLTLGGNRTGSPELRALRAWYPRQSWAERYLPAVYRSEPAPADFLDRFLANMEGTVATIERRIVDAQTLLDPRTAPAESLDWLASWFDVALDPAWSEAQRRLLIGHAARFLSLRGTKRGVETALALAFSQCADERLFEDPEALRTDIRITESFLSNRLSALARSSVQGAPFWSPEESNVALAERVAVAMGEDHATPDQRSDPVPFYPPADRAADWRSAVNAVIGFVPTVGAVERERWQDFQQLRGREAPFSDLPRGTVLGSDAADWKAFVAVESVPRRLWQEFLEGRYSQLARLNSAHESAWTNFAEVSLFDRLPATEAARRDWHDFETLVLPAHASAHRFTVLLPVRNVGTDMAALGRDRELARRIVDLEKPAHTVFDVRFYFAMNRIGEARLGFDTTLGSGSRGPELLPPAILGRAYLGESFVGPDGSADTEGRRRLAC